MAQGEDDEKEDDKAGRQELFALKTVVAFNMLLWFGNLAFLGYVIYMYATQKIKLIILIGAVLNLLNTIALPMSCIGATFHKWTAMLVYVTLNGIYFIVAVIFLVIFFILATEQKSEDEQKEGQEIDLLQAYFQPIIAFIFIFLNFIFYIITFYYYIQYKKARGYKGRFKKKIRKTLGLGAIDSTSTSVYNTRRGLFDEMTAEDHLRQKKKKRKIKGVSEDEIKTIESDEGVKKGAKGQGNLKKSKLSKVKS